MGSFDLHKFTFHHVIIICANAHLVKPFQSKRFEFLLKKCLTGDQKEYIIEVILSTIQGFYMDIQPKDTSKGHFYISLIKSGMRIIAGAYLITGDFVIAGLLLITAELLGILEEMV